MAASIRKLYRQKNNPYRLELKAGDNGIRNTVSWMFMLEDETTVNWFHGAELIVTTGMKAADDPGWLLRLVRELSARRTAGLIVNTGMYIAEIPQYVLDYCDEKEFPLLTMPWEMRITDLIQDFCLAIITDRSEALLHDQAIRDAIQKKDNEEEYREILAKHYDIEGRFLVIAIYARYQDRNRPEDGSSAQANHSYWLQTRLSRLRTGMNLPKVRIGIVDYEHVELLTVNNAPQEMICRILEVVLEVYNDEGGNREVFIGVGTEVRGIGELAKSFQSAVTAARMARYRGEPVVRFADMGIYKILFSVKDEKVLYDYADEMLGGLDALGEKKEMYLELLKMYIHCDRSLEHTANELYLHRNTVNYRVQKLKELLGSPLKTAEDLFPFQAALAIREMQRKQREHAKKKT